MEYKLKKNNNATVQITVKNSADEVESAYQSAYSKARSNLKLPGFRKGKAPVDLVEKHLGESVANDAARALIADTLGEIITKLDPPPINMPTFDVEEFERGKGAVYVGQYDTVPEVKLGKYRKVKVTVDEAKVSDKDVQSELERLRKENALQKTREEEPVQAEDRVVVELEVLPRESEGAAGDEGQSGAEEPAAVASAPVSLYKSENYEVTADGHDLLHVPELAKNVIGKKAGDELDFPVEFDSDHTDANLAGKKAQVKARLKEVHFSELPALDDDFAQDLGEYENLAALQADIRQKILEHIENHVRNRAQREIIEKIVEDSKIIVPSSIIENEFNRRVSQVQQRYGTEMDLDSFARALGQEPEKLQAEFRAASEKSVQEEIVLLEVSKKEKIEVSEADIEEELRTTLGGHFPEDRLKELLDKKEVQDDIKSRLMYKKTVDWLFENANQKAGKEITFDMLNAAESA